MTEKPQLPYDLGIEYINGQARMRDFYANLNFTPKKWYEFSQNRWPDQIIRGETRLSRTRQEYNALAKRIEEFWVIGPDNNRYLMPQTIERFIASIKGNFWNPQTVSFVKAYLKCYKYELKAHNIDIEFERDHTRRFKPLPTTIERKSMPKDDIYRILSVCRDKSIKLAIRILFETGLRISEYVDIKTVDIDFEERTMRGIGKGAKEFKVKFSPTSAIWLWKWMEDYSDDKEHPFWLYSKQSGEPYTAQRVIYHAKIAGVCRLAGYPGMHPHTFRHSLGVHLRKELGLDIMQIKEKLRHSSITSTQIYVPATTEEVDGVVDDQWFNRPDPLPKASPSEMVSLDAKGRRLDQKAMEDAMYQTAPPHDYILPQEDSDNPYYLDDNSEIDDADGTDDDSQLAGYFGEDDDEPPSDDSEGEEEKEN